VVIITGTGRRTAESYNGAPSGAPRLYVEYTTGPPANRAPSVDAGSDQTITLPEDRADLDGTVTDDGLPDQPGIVTATWRQVSGPDGLVVAFDDKNAEDTGATFPGAGTYELMLECYDGERTASDQVTIVVNEEGSVITLEVSVAGSSDDAEERDNGSVSLTSSDLELVDASRNQTVGLRFVGLDIPPGATIVDAYVQFQVDETGSQETFLTIEGQATDDAPVFTSAIGDISSRGKTIASVDWSPAAWNSVGAAGPDQQTPDISSIIEEIVNLPGWASGNSLVVIITGTGRRTAESYNGAPSGAPRLQVEYTTGI